MATWPLRYHDSIGDFYTPGVKGVGVNRAGLHLDMASRHGCSERAAQSGLHRVSERVSE